LPDGDIDTTNLLRRVAGFPVGFLVDDRVDGDGGLAGLAVTNDQLTLTAAHGNHGVDCLDSGLQRFVNTAPSHDARCLKLQCATLFALDGTQTINRVSERVDHASEVSLAHGHGENLSGPGYFLPRLDATELAQNNHTDFVLIEVLCQAQGAIGKLDQLVGHAPWQTLHVSDAIGGIHNVTDLRGRGGTGVVGTSEVFEGFADFIRVDGDFCHGSSFFWVFSTAKLSGASQRVSFSNLVNE